MMHFVRNIAFAAVAAVGLAGGAQAAVVNINNGDTIDPIDTTAEYLFETVLEGTGGAGSFSFTFVADAADTPLPVMSVTANLFGLHGGSLLGGYLSWFDGTNTNTVALDDITAGPLVIGTSGALGTLFTSPDALTQVLTLGWASRSGTVQVSMNVAAVPLPAGGLLLLGGLGALAAVRRRKAAA